MVKASPAPLDRNSPTPLHIQLKAAIDGRIESGEWAPERQLPSERKLCEQFQVSRITVRQALQQVVSSGRLIRVHGRGTFVAASPLKKRLLPLVGFSEDMRARGQLPGARVLRFESIAASASLAQSLGITQDEAVIALRRLRLANGHPMALETVYLPERICPGILSENLEDGSLYRLLREKYRVQIGHALQQWQAVACPAADAKLLGIRGGSPVLQIQRTTFDANDRPFEWLESYFRGDRYVFFAEMANEEVKRANRVGAGALAGKDGA